MPNFSYKKAKACNAISEVNQERLMSLFLAHFDQVQFNKGSYEHAATEIGGTPETIQVQISMLKKKLREKGCALEQSDGEDGNAANATKVGNKKAAPKKAATPKRKASDSVAMDEDGGKKPGKKGKKAAVKPDTTPETESKEETVDSQASSGFTAINKET